MGEGLVVGRDIKLANQRSHIQDSNIKATSEELIHRLLSGKWTNLLANHSSLDGQSCKGGEDPGVYLLAYSDKDLEGKNIDLEDIFYVGMSNSRGGVNQRLKQFIDAIEKGSKAHSAGVRFFKKCDNSIPFSQVKSTRKFYVACITIPCVVEKPDRKPDDLRKMGDVVSLEYYVLAHIKEFSEQKQEPKLNKK